MKTIPLSLSATDTSPNSTRKLSILYNDRRIGEMSFGISGIPFIDLFPGWTSVMPSRDEALDVFVRLLTGNMPAPISN